MKKTIKLNENDLTNIVKKIMNESEQDISYNEKIEQISDNIIFNIDMIGSLWNEIQDDENLDDEVIENLANLITSNFNNIYNKMENI
jgi:hypothetical protein